MIISLFPCTLFLFSVVSPLKIDGVKKLIPSSSNKFQLKQEPLSIRTIESNILKKCASAAIAFVFLLNPSNSIAVESKSVKDIIVSYDGVPVKLRDKLGSKGTLVVNVASYCALTPQYKDLVSLDEKYKSSGLEILAFPCNQFGSQEPSPVKTIRADMANQFGVKFPIFDKIDVNGPGEHPLYTRLKNYDGPIIGSPNVGKISWNFEKFLLNSEGVPVRRYKPGIKPGMLEEDIAGLLTRGVVPERKRVTLNDF